MMGQLHRRRHLQFPHHEHCTVLHSLLPVSSNATSVWLLALVFVTCSGTLFTAVEGKSLTDVTSPVERQQVFKRSAIEASDYPDFQAGVRYDEYPVIVPKRTALLLDRIMAALQKAVEDDKAGPKFAPDMGENKMDLQRRGQEKEKGREGRVYWRCYFNAVSCFKRK